MEERITKLEAQVAELVTVLTRQAEMLAITQAAVMKLVDKFGLIPDEVPVGKPN